MITPPTDKKELARWLFIDGPRPIQNCIVSPNGEMFVTQSTQNISFWDKEGSLLRELEAPGHGWVKPSFANDGNSVFIGISNGDVIRYGTMFPFYSYGGRKLVADLGSSDFERKGLEGKFLNILKVGNDNADQGN